MKKILVLFFSLIIFISCEEKKIVDCGMCGLNMNRVETPDSPVEAVQMSSIKDTSTTGDAEFLENKAKIEKIYGEQWDFCHCVIVNDSLNKQIKAGKIDDNLMERMEVVDQHCKAFLVMDDSKTPDEREAHEKKIKKCLKSAGIKY
jgi:hypothetical protein